MGFQMDFIVWGLGVFGGLGVRNLEVSGLGPTGLRPRLGAKPQDLETAPSTYVSPAPDYPPPPPKQKKNDHPYIDRYCPYWEEYLHFFCQALKQIIKSSYVP